jgi:hypothetical protein
MMAFNDRRDNITGNVTCPECHVILKSPDDIWENDGYIYCIECGRTIRGKKL